MFKASSRALGCAAALVLLAGCGGGSAGKAGDIPAAAKDETLAKLVPTDVAADGKLVFGTDASYAPNEFRDTDNKTIIGMDVDLGTAVAQKLGLNAEFQDAPFGSLLLGIGSNRTEAAISSLTIKRERTNTVDMVSYFNAGTKAAVPKGNPERISLDDLCGKAVGVQLDTVQVDDLKERSAKCQAAGKAAINITGLQAQSDVTFALSSKRIVAMLADAPVVNYAVTQTNGQVEALGNQYGAAPYGITLAKNRGELTKAVQGAIDALIKDGTYAKILAKWNAGDGAINASQVNPDTGQ